MRYVGQFSRESEVAFEMGILAAQDRSYAVRHYGCALLAYSLRADALPALSLLLKHSDRRTVEDAKAAIDAIKSKNHNFFRDRNYSGRVLGHTRPSKRLIEELGYYFITSIPQFPFTVVSRCRPARMLL